MTPEFAASLNEASAAVQEAAEAELLAQFEADKKKIAESQDQAKAEQEILSAHSESQRKKDEQELMAQYQKDKDKVAAAQDQRQAEQDILAAHESQKQAKAEQELLAAREEKQEENARRESEVARDPPLSPRAFSFCSLMYHICLT